MDQKLVILGGGISGIGAAVLAKKNGINVFVSDNGTIKEEDKKILIKNNIEWEEGKHTKEIILSAFEIIKSPGIPETSSIITESINHNIPVVSEIEFAYRYTNAKIISITGTNGKTTTSLLIGHILKKSGYNVLVTGNIGNSFAYSIAENEYDYIVLELSSFQLDGIKEFRSNISIILNISADHLDRYDYNLQNYINSKFRITQNQESEDFLIYNSDDPIINKIKTKANRLPISLDKMKNPGGYIDNNKIIINLNNNTMTIQDLALQGKHNMFNSMAAAMAARVLEVENKIIRQSMIDFQNVEHRLEYVITVHGIDFINDSKATNINATWYALESMTKNVIWLAGGVDKGNDYKELTNIVKQKVKSIICLGDNNENIITSFKSEVDTIVQASNMKEAVNQSYNLANHGDVVLLSPACASFNLFDNYEDRGFQFKNEVRKL